MCHVRQKCVQLAFKHKGIKCRPLKTFLNLFKITSTSCGTSLGLNFIGGRAALKSTIFLTGLRDRVLFPVESSPKSLSFALLPFPLLL
jgi:hypothetical protein